MNKNIINFINFIEGHRIRIKEIHWSTNSNAEHELCDKIIDSILGHIDELAETSMGVLGVKIAVGQIIPVQAKHTKLKDVLNELYSKTIEFRKTLDSIEMNGVANVVDDFLQDVGKFAYRETQK